MTMQLLTILSFFVVLLGTLQLNRVATIETDRRRARVRAATPRVSSRPRTSNERTRRIAA